MLSAVENGSLEGCDCRAAQSSWFSPLVAWLKVTLYSHDGHAAETAGVIHFEFSPQAVGAANKERSLLSIGCSSSPMAIIPSSIGTHLHTEIQLAQKISHTICLPSLIYSACPWSCISRLRLEPIAAADSLNWPLCSEEDSDPHEFCHQSNKNQSACVMQLRRLTVWSVRPITNTAAQVLILSSTRQCRTTQKHARPFVLLYKLAFQCMQLCWCSSRFLHECLSADTMLSRAIRAFTHSHHVHKADAAQAPHSVTCSNMLSARLQEAVSYGEQLGPRLMSTSPYVCMYGLESTGSQI